MRYGKYIDQFACNPKENLILLGDPLLEGARFYSFPQLTSRFDYDLATELKSDQVDYIEELLMEHDDSYSLVHALAKKLRSVAPAYNVIGYSVFIGSWGMSPEEIGWWVRHLNDRQTFCKYLASSGVTEDSVDLMNSAYNEEYN